jgi:tetratricopeptide (TPR) repeat protein
MNKGIIYEEMNRSKDAIVCYLHAIKIFVQLYENKPIEYGKIINAMFTLGHCNYKNRLFDKAQETLQSTLQYFGEGKENDRRYIAICNTLEELSNIEN